MNINVKLAEHQKIETNRLWLRPFVMSDAADMFEYSSDSSNLRFVFNPHPNLAHTSFVIANYFMKEPLGKWAIELKSEQKMIGLIQFSKLVEQKGTAELSYVLHKKYWNQVSLKGDIEDKMILHLIDHSYEEVIKKFTRKLKQEYNELPD